MSKSKELLKAIVGEAGLETLEKAIFKKRTNAVIDPLEYYLPLLVVPRAILSWLIQNIKPMKVDEVKTLEFPNRPSIKIEIQKQDIDQYRAEFIEGGRVIHSFEKQSLPAVSAHFMTVGEMYESFGENKKDSESKKEESSEEAPSMEVARGIMSIGQIEIPKHDSEEIKWIASHGNVRELSGIIGKLVDALVYKEAKKNKEDLDKSAVKEVQGDSQKIEENQPPKAKKEDNQELNEIKVVVSKPLDKLKDTTPAPKEVPQGKEAASAVISVSQYLRRKAANPVNKTEILAKPYQSEAQRRWAHTEAGTKALGGKEKVKHWDKETKGKDLPEKVGKAEMPAGAAQPKKPAMPKPPKPPVPPSNNPAGAAAKQAQQSAKGKVATPKQPKAPAGSLGPKPPKVGAMTKSGDYFRSKLGKSEVTEDQLYSHCEICGKPQFTKNNKGPEFSPCACFSVVKSDEEGNTKNFVKVLKKSEGKFELQFSNDSDPETVKLFLLSLKARLLIKKNHGV